MPGTYRHNKKYRTGTFLHWYGIFCVLFYISGVTGTAP